MQVMLTLHDVQIAWVLKHYLRVEMSVVGLWRPELVLSVGVGYTLKHLLLVVFSEVHDVEMSVF